MYVRGSLYWGWSGFFDQLEMFEQLEKVILVGTYDFGQNFDLGQRSAALICFSKQPLAIIYNFQLSNHMNL